jgi:hypothetical protein
MTKVQFPGIVRSTFCVKNIIETVLPEPCVCQNTPSFARRGAACSSVTFRSPGSSSSTPAPLRTSWSRAKALFTPRYW